MNIAIEDNGRPEKWLITGLVAMGLFLALLDTTIVDITLPKMMPELNADLNGIQWVIIAYLMGAAIAITVVSWLGDILGHARTYLMGLSIFILMSAFCGTATSLTAMQIGRFFQGVGEGILLPVGLTILYEAFPKRQHGLALGIFALTGMFAPSLGPVLGGLITEYLNWRWIFFVNVPLGILDILLVFLYVPNLRAGDNRKPLDVIGVGLLSVFLAGIIISTGKGEQYGWLTDDFIFYLFLTTLSGFTAYAIYVRFFNEDAIIPLHLFRKRNFVFGLISLFFASCNLFGILLIQPLLLQRLYGYSTIQAGIIVCPAALCMGVGTIASGALADKISPKLLGFTGLILCSIGGAMLSGSVNLSEGQMIGQFMVWSFFIGSTVAPTALIILGDVTDEETNTASATLNVVRLVGGCIGTTFTTYILTTRSGMFYDAIIGRMDWRNPVVQRMLTGGPDDLSGAAMYAQSVGRVAMSSAFDSVFIYLAMSTLVSALAFLPIKQTIGKAGVAVHL